jgi:hypothetical protein
VKGPGDSIAKSFVDVTGQVWSYLVGVCVQVSCWRNCSGLYGAALAGMYQFIGDVSVYCFAVVSSIMIT